MNINKKNIYFELQEKFAVVLAACYLVYVYIDGVLYGAPHPAIQPDNAKWNTHQQSTQNKFNKLSKSQFTCTLVHLYPNN